MSRVMAVLALAALLLVEERARAEPSARLVFIRDAAAVSACPDEAALRRAVEARLGYDPFFPWGQETVVVRFDRDGSGFAARVEMVRGNDARGARTLRSDDPACGGLVDAAALAVTIALDAARPAETLPDSSPAEATPESAGREAPAAGSLASVTAPQDPTPPPAGEPDAGVVPGERGGKSSLPRLHPAVGVDILAAAGSAPTVAPGLAAWGRFGTNRWSLGLEARADVPASAGEHVGTVSSWLLAGGVDPCFHLSLFFACGVVELGAIHGEGGSVSFPKGGYAVFSAIGPRAGVEIPLAPWLALRLRTDVLVNLSRPTVAVDGYPDWTVPVATGTIGGGLAVRFP